MAGDSRNPSMVGGPNEHYALNVDLSRPDASIVGPGGNTVDRARINRTTDAVDKGAQSPAFPLGRPTNLG